MDFSVLAELEQVRQPQDFALVWALNRSLERIEGRYEGADRYLGMGWFQKGTKIWSLNNNPSNTTYAQFENLIVPIEQAGILLKAIIPYMQHYLPTRADFQFITDFALQVIVPDARSKGLTLTLQCNYPQLLPTIQVPQQKIDVLLANQALIQFPYQSLTPVMLKLLKDRNCITIRGNEVPLFIRDQLPVMLRYRQISDDMAAKIVQSNPAMSIATLRPTLPMPRTVELIPRIIELNQQKIAKLHQESAELQERLSVEDEEGQEQSPLTTPHVAPGVTREPAKTVSDNLGFASLQTVRPTVQPEQSHQSLETGPKRSAIKNQFVKPGFIGARYKARENSAVIPSTVQLNQEAISKLWNGSEQLQERLTVEDEKEQEQSDTRLMPEPVPVTPMVHEVPGSSPEVDEDWKIILQQWQPEHWEIIILLYREQYTQLTTVERKVYRPVSRLIDEINLPVDEQLGDLLVDPDTKTIANHFHATVESLVRWYISFKGR